jgi:hypothetical protein
MTAADLTTMYEFSYGAIKRNLDGITHEESLVCPEPNGNCMNWILGHVVLARGSVLTLAGGTPVFGGEDAAHYGRGFDPKADGKVLDLATLRGFLDDAQLQLVASLGALDDDDLAAPLPEKFQRPPLTGSVGDSLARLQNHEMYHAGQIGLLRKILGKAGAIR